MKSLINSIAASALIMLTACGSGSSNELTTIDIEETLDFDNICSDRLSAEIILQPAFTDSTMLSRPNIAGIKNGTAYIVNRLQLMTFDMVTGRCKNSFSHAGQGPEDYASVGSCRVADNGDWTFYNYGHRNVISYRPDGTFVSSFPNKSINMFAQAGDGWVAFDIDADDSGKIFFYNNKWELTDSVAAPVGRHTIHFPGNSSVSYGHRMIPIGNTIYFSDLDTIYAIDGKNHTYAPVVAINPGKYRFPDFSTITSREEFQTLQETKIMAEGYATEKLIVVVFSFGQKGYFQIYDRHDGSLLFNAMLTRESGGFPVEIDGKTFICMPIDYSDGEAIYFYATADSMVDYTGDEDANPAIITIKLK